MSKPIRPAADEAREVARRAHQLAALLDSYADCLSDEELRGRASELHSAALCKLKEIRQVISSEEWLDQSDRNKRHGV